MAERSNNVLDVRSWRLADLLAIFLLVFNIGVTLTRVQNLEKALEAVERRAEMVVAQLQDMRERVVRLEAEHREAERGRP